LPIGVFLFEIDESFGPNLLAQYNIKEKGVAKEALKEIANKHLEGSGLNYATFRKDDLKYYSREIKLNDKDFLYLGFILRPNEFADTLIAVSDNLEKEIVENYSKDKNKLNDLLKEILNARIELNEKLKEPKIIKEKINETTKLLLDEGNIQEARKLIDLGETVPNEMTAAVKLAEDSFKAKDFKESKKQYLKAAELAFKIGELEINKVLIEKSKTAEYYPLNMKHREEIYKKVQNLLKEISSKTVFFQQAIDLINEAIELSDKMEDDLIIGDLHDLKRYCQDSNKLSEDLKHKESLIKKILDKI